MASLKQSAIQLVLKAKDALSGTVKKSAASLDHLKGEAAELKDQLDTLNNQKALLSSFQQQTKATFEASKAFRAAQANVELLAREFDQTAKPTRAMTAALNKARKEVRKSNTAYGRQRETLARMREQLSKAGLSSSKLAQQQQKLSEEIEQTGNAFDKASRKAKAANRALKQDALKTIATDAGRASDSLGRLSRRFAALVAASVGFYSIKRGIESILTTGDQFERLSVQLEAIMGSMAEGERALSWIKEFTRNTPFQLEEVLEAFVRLKAFGLDPMDGTMQAIVDQAAKLGGGMERLNGITLAVGQAWAKQKLQGEEILQLVERGVPVWELLEKATGKNVQELQKLSTAGKLGRDTIALLVAEIGKSAEGAAAKNMTLLSGYVSNLKDSWQQFLAAIADSGALDYTKDVLGNIARSIEAMNQNGRLQALAQKVSDAFVAMGNAIQTALSRLSFDEVVARLQAGFSVVNSALNKLSSTFTITGNTISFFFNSFSVAVKGFATGFLYTIGEIINGWGKLAEVVGADSIARQMQQATNYLRSLGYEFARQTAEDANSVRNSLVGIYDVLVSKHEQSQQSIRRDSKQTADQIKNDQEQQQQAIEQTGKTSEQAAAKIKTAFTDAADAIRQINGAETRTELASLGVALAEALTAGVISQEEYYQATEASRAKLTEFNKEAEKTGKAIKDTGDTAEEAGKQQTEAMEGASSVAEAMAGHYNAIIAELQGLSSAAHDSFIAMQRGLGSVDTREARGSIGDLKNELEEANQKLNDLRHASYVFDATGIRRWFQETATDAAYVKRAFLEQKITLEQLLEQYEQGGVSYQNFVRQGKDAAQNLNLLNQQDLDKLNNAIASAEQSMASLGDSSRNTLNSLRDELDQLQGRQADIEQRRYQNQRDDLKAQRAEATARGDQEAIKNLTSAIRLSEQIYSERVRQANNEKAKAVREQGSTAPRVQQQSPQKIIRLEYPGGDVNVGIAPSDESKLLEALKNAGMRTL